MSSGDEKQLAMRSSSDNEEVSRKSLSIDTSFLDDLENQPLFANKIGSIYDDVDIIKYKVPDIKFLWHFPQYLEQQFAPFDDFLLKWSQSDNDTVNKYWAWIDLLITGMWSIELGIAIPYVLFIIGYDGIAIQLSYLLLFVSIISQFPKRFLWRYRPYMVHRAKKIRKKETAVTSSFPSRAVTCATVYSYLICWSYFHENNEIFKWWMPFIVLISIIVASSARVHLGVHYPSDCALGVVQGILVAIIGTVFTRLNIIACGNCFDNKCYSQGQNAITSNSLNFPLNWGLFAIFTAGSLLVVFFSIVRPIEFWEKCDRVYGMLFPGIVFQISFVCPNITTNSLGLPHEPKWYSVFFGLGLASFCTLIGFKFGNKIPMLSYLFIYSILFVSLLFWRLFVL